MSNTMKRTVYKRFHIPDDDVELRQPGKEKAQAVGHGEVNLKGALARKYAMPYYPLFDNMCSPQKTYHKKKRNRNRYPKALFDVILMLLQIWFIGFRDITLPCIFYN